MDEREFRPVELQSPEDVRYLLSRVEVVAREKVDAALPDGGDVVLRERVRELVLEYVHKTFTLAQPNITVNGLPSLPLSSYLQPVDEYERFDSRLQADVARLHALIEERTLRNAALRRSVPALVRDGFEEAINEETKRGERVVKGWEKRVKEEEGGEGLEREVERRAEVEECRDRAVAGLERLMKGFPEVGGRLEKAGAAAGYVLAKRERERRVGRSERGEGMEVDG